jgi:signal transduction histidine kinase
VDKNNLKIPRNRANGVDLIRDLIQIRSQHFKQNTGKFMHPLSIHRRPTVLRGILRQRKKYNRALKRLFSPKPPELSRERVFAAVHDLKNPICSILNLTSVLLGTPFEQLEESRHREMLELIQKLTRKMNELAEEMLPPHVPQKLVSRTPKQANHLLGEAAALWRPLAAERGISLEVIPMPTDEVVSCDACGIFRVFSNLIGNAVRHSEPGTVITLSAENAGNRVLFKVRDQGCGIAPAELQLIFERYWQGQPRKLRGNGLGLAISREIVSAHGGKIWAERPQDGPGSLFCFTLPV